MPSSARSASAIIHRMELHAHVELSDETWKALLAYEPPVSRRAKAVPGAGGPVPKTATMPPKRNEIPPPSQRRP